MIHVVKLGLIVVAIGAVYMGFLLWLIVHEPKEKKYKFRGRKK